MTRPALLAFFPLWLGCGGVSGSEPQSAHSLQNPTGDCAAPDDGARAGYHVPAGSSWLPDCRNPLAREYWRVFAQTQDSAYVIPRPDAAIAVICREAQHEVYELLQRNELCGEQGQAFVQRVNHLPPADALELTHYLHMTLRFEVELRDGRAVGITPYPLPSDIVDACAQDSGSNSAELEAICQRERQRLESGADIGFSYDGPGAVELAAKLNELYAIR